MDANTAIVAAFGALATGFLALFGWTLSQTNKLSISHAALVGSLRESVERLDKLVIKLDQNFSIQISEQVARNVLQEKVRGLEAQMRDVQRRVLGTNRLRDAAPEEENGS